MNVSDWKPGSRWEHRRLDDARTVDVTGTVIESDPPRRLVLSWARPAEVQDTAKHSRVTSDIASHGERLIKLTVTHDDLEKDPKVHASVSGGWPMVLSSMKTMLESGRALRQSARS